MTLRPWYETDLKTEFLADFAEEVGYHDGDRPHTLKAIFNNEYFPAEFVEADVEGRAPEVFIASEDVPSIAQGHTFTIRGVVYQVVNVQPDGTGLVRVILSKDRGN